MLKNRRGQTIVEFTLTAATLLLTITAAGGLLKAQWNRAKCAYLVFEATHAHLTGAIGWTPDGGAKIRVYEGPGEISGEGQCGQANEHVSLKKLETVRWP